MGLFAPIIATLLAFLPAIRVEQRQVTDPPPMVPAAPDNSQCPQWYGPALDAGWPPEQWPTLDYVLHRESRCDPHAYNRSGAAGLMQLMPMWWRGRGDPFDGPTNLALGLELWHRTGWRSWCLRGDRVTGSC